jgi:hypothetical protein
MLNGMRRGKLKETPWLDPQIFPVWSFRSDCVEIVTGHHRDRYTPVSEPQQFEIAPWHRVPRMFIEPVPEHVFRLVPLFRVVLGKVE